LIQNICVYWLKGYENIESKAIETGLDSLSISFITLADIFIAACALAEDLTLVTNNEKHFERIEGLRIENWL